MDPHGASLPNQPHMDDPYAVIVSEDIDVSDPTPQPHWTQRRGVSLAVSLLIVAAAGVVVLLAMNSEGSPQPGLFPGQIRRLSPNPGDQVPHQTRVGVIVSPTWSAELSINGTDIPLAEMTIRSSLGEYFYDPGPGKVIEELPPGRICVVASARSQLDDEDPVSHAWCFSAF
jgi:hypothetical protein